MSKTPCFMALGLMKVKKYPGLLFFCTFFLAFLKKCLLLKRILHTLGNDTNWTRIFNDMEAEP